MNFDFDLGIENNGEENMEEQMCTCGRYYAQRHGWCGLCIDNWIDDNFITNEIYEAGYKFGQDLGWECGRRHTINCLGRDDIWVLDDIDIPQYAYIDRKAYERGFETGYTSAYNSVYRLHRPAIKQLEWICKSYFFRMWVFKKYGNRHPLFDIELLGLIEQLVPQIKKTKKIPTINFTV